MFGFEDSEMNFFNRFNEIAFNEDRNQNALVELTKLKRESEVLYRKCVQCQRMVEDYAEKLLKTNGQKPQITKSNYKELLHAAQQISELGGK